jgi:hypothetical protein
VEEFAEVVCDIVGAAEGFGQAMTAEGAPTALWLENSGRNSSTPEQRVEPGDRVFGLGAEFGCELDLAPRLALLVIDRAAGDGRSEHFFEAEGLGAKLDVVVVPPAFLAAFIFDGRDDLDDRLAPRSSSRLAPELDEIGAAEEPKTSGRDPEPAFGTDPFPFFKPGLVGPLVQGVAAERVLVVDVKPVEVPQRRAAVAVEQGVERGEGDEVVPLGIGGSSHGLGFT